VSLPGSSGSPVFNGDGEVVAVHRASSEGLKFAVPIPLLIPLLPTEVKAELGLP
jgi:S1-C subfamily serine protease